MRNPFHFSTLLVARIFKNRNVVTCFSTVLSYKPTELNAASLKSHEKDYLRSALSKYSGCILYKPSEKLNARDFINPPQKTTFTDNNASKRLPLKRLFNDEFVQKLSILAQTGITPDPNVVNQLETQCFQEYKLWPIDKQIYILELWHHIPESIQNSKFIWSARNELLKRFSELSYDHALQTLYYLTWLRGPMTDKQFKILENRFSKEINTMTLDAMSIWCLALFRNGETVKNRKLIEKIYSKLLQSDLNKFHEIGLSSVLKTIRTASTPYQATMMMQLLEKLHWHAKHSNLMLISQIAFVGNALKIYDVKLLDTIVKRIGSQVDRMRFKDLERICLIISKCDHNSNAVAKLLQNIGQHLLTVEKHSYLASVIRCIEFMQRCGYLDTKLIAWALDPKTIADAYNETKKSTRSELLSIDMYVEINLVNKYSGPRLNANERAAIARQRIDDAYEDWTQLRQIEKMLRESGRHCAMAHALPHYKTPDVLLVVDFKRKETIDITSKIPRSGTLIRAADLTKGHPQSRAIAIVVATGTHYLFGMKKFGGYFKCKLKQLEMVGYEVVISSKEWTTMNNGERKKFLDEILSKTPNK